MNPGRGLDSNNSDIGILFFQETPDTGNCPAGAERGKEMGDLTFGLIPDFRPGCAVMGFNVQLILIRIALS